MKYTVLLFLFCSVLTITYANDVNRRRMEAKRLGEETQVGDYLHFAQLLDHFTPGENILTGQTFNQRFLVNNTFWDPKNNGPVFLIIGGEGPLSSRSVTNGAVVEYAQQQKALLFALEHRFYGDSVPFETLNVSALSYLTTTQALADLEYFQQKMGTSYALTSANQWFVFGCSYSGALAAWYRLKYPHLAVGAMSSSSPVEAELSFYQYDQVVASSLGEKCANSVRAATAFIQDTMDNSTLFDEIKARFGCQAVTNNVGFLYVLADIIAFAVQYNTSYGLVPELCYNFTTSIDTVQTYVEYANLIFTKYNGPCVEWDISQFTNQTVGTNDNMRQWMWQSCDELGYFQTAPTNNSLRSTLITADWHLVDVCENIFGVALTPKVDWTNSLYGGQNIVTSNTVFTNGGSDPWKELSVVKSLGTSVPAIIIDGEAHCSNWYGSSPNDTSFLKNGRALGGSYVQAFLTACGNNCNSNGVCTTRKTGDTSVASECVCYSGWGGNLCQDSITAKSEKMVPWWSVLIAVIGSLVVAGVIGGLFGARYARSKQYSAI